ncbi:MAG: hypothetical protein Q9169_007551, partial [Polycauliona sp. 2 TL-2023]
EASSRQSIGAGAAATQRSQNGTTEGGVTWVDQERPRVQLSRPLVKKPIDTRSPVRKEVVSRFPSRQATRPTAVAPFPPSSSNHLLILCQDTVALEVHCCTELLHCHSAPNSSTRLLDSRIVAVRGKSSPLTVGSGPPGLVSTITVPADWNSRHRL